MKDTTIYKETIEVRELPEIVKEIERFKDESIYFDTMSQAIRVLIRRGLIDSGYLQKLTADTYKN